MATSMKEFLFPHKLKYLNVQFQEAKRSLTFTVRIQKTFIDISHKNTHPKGINTEITGVIEGVG